MKAEPSGEHGPAREPICGKPDQAKWTHGELAEDHVMLMGANSYRVLSEIVANGDDPTFPPGMAELPKIVFSKTLEPSLTWANTSVVSEPVEPAVLALKAMDDTPMRTIGSPSLVRSLFRLGLVGRAAPAVSDPTPRRPSPPPA
jgi:dihydrofolate reductase